MTDVKLLKSQSEPHKFSQDSNEKKKNFLKLNKQNLKKSPKLPPKRNTKDLTPKPIIETPKKAATEKINFNAKTTTTTPMTRTTKASAASKAVRFKAGSSGAQPLNNSAKKKNVENMVQTQTEQNLLQSPRVHQSVQTYNNLTDESFLKDAKIIEPSDRVLEEIRQQKLAEIMKSTAEVRKFEKYAVKDEIHIENLKEFFEKGSISRRRRTNEKMREQIQRKLNKYGVKTESYTFSDHLDPPKAELFEGINTAIKEAAAVPSMEEDSEKLILVYKRK